MTAPMPSTIIDKARSELEAIAIALGVSPPAFFGSERKSAHISAVRHAAWTVLRDRGYSLIAIARATGVDHTSVIYGERKVESDPSRYRPLIEIASKTLEAPASEPLLCAACQRAAELYAYHMRRLEERFGAEA